jgi:hypothetical protein
MLSPHKRPGEPHRSFGPPSPVRLILLLIVVVGAIWMMLRTGG